MGFIGAAANDGKVKPAPSTSGGADVCVLKAVCFWDFLLVELAALWGEEHFIKLAFSFYHFFFNHYFLRALSSKVNSLDGFRSPEQLPKQLLMEITKSFFKFSRLFKI